MAAAHKIASRNLSLARLKQKTWYNNKKKASQAKLEIEDKVIAKVFVIAGLHKLAVKYKHSVWDSWPPQQRHSSKCSKKW